MLFYFSELIKLTKEFSCSSSTYLLAGWLIGLLIVKVASRLRSILFFRVTNGAVRDIREQLLHHLHQTSLATWGQKHAISSIMSSSQRISSSVRGFMNSIFIQALPTSLKLFSLVAGMIYLHHASLFFLIPMAIGVIMAYWNLKRFLKARKSAWKISDEVFLTMQESLANTRKIRLEKGNTQEYTKKMLDQEEKKWWTTNLHENMVFLLQAIFFWIGFVLMVTYIIRGTIKNRWEFATLLLMKGYALTIYKNLGFITRQLQKLFTCMIDLKKVIDIFETPIEKRGKKVLLTKESSHSTNMITLKNVSFSFSNPYTPVLKNISLTIQEGDKVGIIGLSGVGKSTLCHLLTGLYLPTEGKVSIHTMATKDLNPANIGKEIDFIHQEAILETNPEQKQGKLEKKFSFLGSKELKNLSKRDLGENGNHISSGQKQRLLLARSLAKKPKVMVLDEALSAIDEETAQAMLEEILLQVPTVILISHRLSLMQQLDKIYHLQNGKISLLEKASLLSL